MLPALAFPPELELVVACCAWAGAGRGEHRFEKPVRELDWSLFEVIARRHHVEALAWRGLTERGIETPAASANRLKEAARKTAAATLRQTGRCIQLRRQFLQVRIPILFIKGVTLEALAYGRRGLRKSKDIDILVPAADLLRSARVLEENEFRLILPKADLEPWHRHSKESVWLHSPTGIILELHTALFNNPMLLANMEPFSASREVEVAPGLHLPTLPPDELLAYLLVHGASSGWFRLKWLTDVAALLSTASQEEISRIYDRSQELGAGRAAGQAMLLLRTLFSIEPSASLMSEIDEDRVAGWLASVAMKQLCGPTLVRDPAERRFGTASIHLGRLALLPGLRYKAGELRHQVTSRIRRAVRGQLFPRRGLTPGRARHLRYQRDTNVVAMASERVKR